MLQINLTLWRSHLSQITRLSPESLSWVRDVSADVHALSVVDVEAVVAVVVRGHNVEKDATGREQIRPECEGLPEADLARGWHKHWKRELNFKEDEK